MPDHEFAASGMAHAFKYPERLAGRALFEESAVVYLELSDNLFEAQIKDEGMSYRCSIELVPEENTWQSSCTCRIVRRTLCRHLYATILERDRKLLGARIVGRPAPGDVEAFLSRRLAIADGRDMGALTVPREIERIVEEIARDWDSGSGESVPDDELIGFEDLEWPQDVERMFDAVRRVEHLELSTAVPDHLRRTSQLHYLVTPTDDKLLVQLRRRTRNNSGKWGKPAQATQEIDRHQLPPEDRAILTLLCGSRSSATHYPHRFADAFDDAFNPAHPQLVGPELAQIVLPKLLETGRCHLRDPDRYDTTELTDPLYASSDPPVRFLVRSEETAKKFRLVGTLIRGDRLLPSTCVVLANRFVVIGREVVPLDPVADPALLRSLLGYGPLEVDAMRRDRLLQRFVFLPGARHIEDDELLASTAHDLERYLTLEDPTTHRRQSLTAHVEFDYGDGDRTTPHDVRTHFVHDGTLRPRDHAAEAQAIAELDALDISLIRDIESRPDPTENALVPRANLEVRVLELLNLGWSVFAAGYPVTRGECPQVSVSTGIDWFEVEAAFDFGEQTLTLPELLRLRGKAANNLIRLGDGSLGILASEWLDRWQRMLELGEVVDGVLKLRSNQAWLIDAMLEDLSAEIDVDAAFDRARESLSNLREVKPHRTPRGFGTTLRAYQREGLGWLSFLHEISLGGCLADDMGLGKTVQVLALLWQKRKARRHPTLVVCPRSLIDNWRRETEKLCPGFVTATLLGSNRRRDHAADIANGFADIDIVLTTFGTLRRDIEWLAEIQFGYAILDEAQEIKNPRSQISKAVRLLRAEHRLALTGTPIENRIQDLWSLFEFLNPGMLGRSSVFQKLASSGAKTDTPEFAERLHAAVRPFLLRRTKDAVLHDLPPKSEQTLYVELPPAQRKRYDELRDFYRESILGRLESIAPGAAGLGEHQMFVLEALLRLRQAACHTALLTDTHENEDSGKFETLLPILEELVAGGHKALVFSQFTSLLALLRPHLDARELDYEYLDGSTRDRQQRVDRFQSEPSCSLFLISIKAG